MSPWTCFAKCNRHMLEGRRSIRKTRQKRSKKLATTPPHATESIHPSASHRTWALRFGSRLVHHSSDQRTRLGGSWCLVPKLSLVPVAPSGSRLRRRSARTRSARPRRCHCRCQATPTRAREPARPLAMMADGRGKVPRPRPSR